jgi:uncharacterized membrane protein
MKISKHRVESFSDGVIAIIITIMVLNIPLPKEFTINELIGFLNSIFVFFVSFIVVGSQWNKQRHLFENIYEVTNKIIWRNMLFLFFLSLMPIFTKWVIENLDQVIPAIGYDIVFLLVNISYQFIWNGIINENAELKRDMEALKSEGKFFWLRFILMLIVIAAIIVLSIFNPRISLICFIVFPVILSLFNLIYENNKNYGRHTILNKSNNVK